MTEGRKDDIGKPRFSLLPWDVMGHVIDVFEWGARKYGIDNWRGLKDVDRRCFDACMRHLVAWKAGETRDPETNLPHLAHATVNLFFLLSFAQYPRLPMNDLPKDTK